MAKEKVPTTKLIAEELNKFFKEMEEDLTFNIEREGYPGADWKFRAFDGAGAWAIDAKQISICYRNYISHQGRITLGKQQAFEYLKALRGGYRNRYFEWVNKVDYIDIDAGWRRLCGMVHGNITKALDNDSKFLSYFGVSLKSFMDKITGFDIIKFDEFLKVPDGVSTKEFLESKYGSEASSFVLSLI